MSKRYAAGTPLSAAISATDWNEVLETRDIVRNRAKPPRDLFSGDPRITVLCKIDQAGDVALGDIVELRNSEFTLVTNDLSDQLFQEPVLTCKHFANSNANIYNSKFGVACQPGKQSDLIEIAIAGVVVAKVSGSGEWGYIDGATSTRLKAGASGFCKILQSFGATYSLVHLGQRQPLWRLTKGSPHSLADAAGVATGTSANLTTLSDPHAIITAIATGALATVEWRGDGILQVIQGTC